MRGPSPGLRAASLQKMVLLRWTLDQPWSMCLTHTPYTRSCVSPYDILLRLTVQTHFTDADLEDQGT